MKTLYNHNGIQVLEVEHPAPIGIEYKIVRGNTTINQNDYPALNHETLSRHIDEYERFISEESIWEAENIEQNL